MNIRGYWINWKGFEDAREPMEITVKEGLRYIAGWADGEKIFIHKGGAYSYSSVESIQPMKTSYQGKTREGETITEDKAMESIKELLNGRELKQLSA